MRNRKGQFASPTKAMEATYNAILTRIQADHNKNHHENIGDVTVEINAEDPTELIFSYKARSPVQGLNGKKPVVRHEISIGINPETGKYVAQTSFKREEVWNAYVIGSNPESPPTSQFFNAGEWESPFGPLQTDLDHDGLMRLIDSALEAYKARHSAPEEKKEKTALLKRVWPVAAALGVIGGLIYSHHNATSEPPAQRLSEPTGP